MPGGKRSTVPYERVSMTIPAGIYQEMLRIIESEQRWADRVDFIREAIREKIERWKREHPLGPPARR